jgi:hypothetical protein
MTYNQCISPGGHYIFITWMFLLNIIQLQYIEIKLHKKDKLHLRSFKAKVISICENNPMSYRFCEFVTWTKIDLFNQRIVFKL